MIWNNAPASSRKAGKECGPRRKPSVGKEGNEQAPKGERRVVTHTFPHCDSTSMMNGKEITQRLRLADFVAAEFLP